MEKENRKIAFYTLGCKVNQYETDLLKEKFEQNGYNIVGDNEYAEIYCINTCTVTNMSDRKTRQVLSRMRKQNPGSIIAVVGCYVESVKGTENEGVSGADIILGNEYKKDLFDVINNMLNGIDAGISTREEVDISDVKEYTSQGMLSHGYDVRESVKIEDGCNNFCSYCIIPYVRGRVRSRDINEIVAEVQSLALNGVKEIVLVGIEVASYGNDKQSENQNKKQRLDLIDVIEKVSEVKRIERVRVGSLEPRILTRENLERLRNIDKFCPHFHISMQSGDSDTLKRMNRKYDVYTLVEVADNIHGMFKGSNITADCIVGFPGETEDEFNNTINTIKKMGLSEIHVFKYSKRRFTKAAEMEEQIDGNIKKQRSDKLIKLSTRLKERYMIKFIRKRGKVLFESFSNDGYLKGYLSNYIQVKARGDKNLCGTIQDVDLISLEKDMVLGVLS